MILRGEEEHGERFTFVNDAFGGNTILVGFSKHKQSLHYSLFSATTRRCFIPVPLSVKTLSESFRCSYFCSANTEPTAKPPPLPALARHRADHQAITRELGNPEEIQSLKGLNTGRGSPLVAPAAHCAEWDHWGGGACMRGLI